MPSQILLALPLCDVRPSIHSAQMNISSGAQDTFSHNQRFILDLIKKTNRKNTDMKWARRVSLNHHRETDKYKNG